MVNVTNTGSHNIIVPQSTLYFGGSGSPDYVTISASPHLSPASGNSLSASAWVYPHRYQGVPTGGWPVIVGKGVSGRWGLGYNTNASQTFQFHVSGKSGDLSRVNAATIISGNWNTWHHVAGVYDNANKELRIYIDGKLDATTTDAKYGIYSWSTNDIYIGWNGANRSMSGQIYDVRIWSGTALTEGDVKRVYYGLDVQTDKLVAHYKFLDREGTTLTDSVNKLNGTINRAEWVERKIKCWNTRWDEGNWDLTVETFLDVGDRNFLFRNVVPGAYRELYNILGTPKYIDTTYSSSNTLILEPISGYGISSLREKRTIAVKNIADTFIVRDKFGVKIEGIRLDI